MRRMMTVLGGVALALAVAGCRSVDTVEVGDTLGGPPYQWVQTDDDLNEFAKVVSARRDRQNGLLRVQVDLKNTRRNEERIVYRFVWLDEKGIEVSSIQNDWMPKIMGGSETVQIVGIAPDPRVVTCIVKLQETVR